MAYIAPYGACLVATWALVRRMRASEERSRELAESSLRMSEEQLLLQLIVERQRDEANDMLATQNALQEIATRVASGAEPADVFAHVAAQVATLLGGSLGGVVRFDAGAGVGVLAGGWSDSGEDTTGRTVDLSGPTAAATVYRTGAIAHVVQHVERADDALLEKFAIGQAVAAPVLVGGKLWGSVGVAFSTAATMPSGVSQRLGRFADLVAVAISNAEAWETLERRASTDSVTGLANHRVFHARLRAESRRATRHGRSLSVVLLDLDHFKRINDTHGHQAGDEVLVAVADRLAALARPGDLVARIGGEEFGWLMPGATPDDAYLLADRARCAIQAEPFDVVGSLTISAGVSSNDAAAGAEELFSAADQALYRAKRAGRNTTFIHGQPDPAVAVDGVRAL